MAPARGGDDEDEDDVDAVLLLDRACTELASCDGLPRREVSAVETSCRLVIANLAESRMPLPSSFFRLVLAIANKKEAEKRVEQLWLLVRELTSAAASAVPSPLMDDESCVLALSAFLQRFLSSRDAGDVSVIEGLLGCLESSPDEPLLPTRALFDLVSSQLLGPAAVVMKAPSCCAMLAEDENMNEVRAYTIHATSSDICRPR